MRGLKNRICKKLTFISMAVYMSVVLVGCGASDVAQSNSYIATPMEEQAYESYAVAPQESFDSGEAKAEESGSSSSSRVVDSSRKLIKTVDMDVETQNFEQLMTTIQTQVAELGGYIESMNTYNGSAYTSRTASRNANLTIRIPKDKLDSFLNTVSGVSNVVRRSDNVEDVTLTYVDLESHRDVLEAEQERLLQFLEQAETIEEMITLESRLSEVRYQLESMESQLRTFDNQVDYSTVYLDVDEVEIFTPVEEKNVWERISGGFMESLDNVGEGLVEFVIWFIVTLPYFFVITIVVVIIILIIRGGIKLASRPAKKSQVQTVQVQNMQNLAMQNPNMSGANMQKPITQNQGAQGANAQNPNAQVQNVQNTNKPEQKQ